MRNLLILLSAASLFSCAYVTKNAGESAIQYKNIAKHIAELSSDRYKGRMPLTPGEGLTVDYISGQMKEIGLEPANNGSYFQEVPLLAVSSKISNTLDFSTPKGTLYFKKMVDYVTFSRRMEEEQTLDQSELVFAGFGITAPEYFRDDFQGMDLKGKTILVFVNDPGYGTSDAYFKGNTMTYYGRWTYKFEEAARRGAKGCLIIHATGPAGYPWKVVANNGESTKLYLKPDNGYQDRCAFEGWISQTAAEQLFASCGMSFDQAKKMAIQKDFKPVVLPVKVSGWMKSSFETKTSRNVCGLIRGSKHPDEAVVYTAHWDHLGVGIPVNNDSIYNGASDNASAVAWMLEIARGFKKGPTPERSVLFLSVTSEESGLLGSSYYTEHPFFPMSKTVACINTDVMLFLGRFKDVTLTGIGQSELDEWVRREAALQGRYIAPDPNPENGMYFRSDQFPFVKKGVPAIYAKGYVNADKYGKDETLKILDHYWKEIYHSPFDEYHPTTDDLRGIVEDAKLLFRVGTDLANSKAWPAWNADSEFKAERENSRNQN
ncbi:MAG TPA: M28 family peptidase [Prolixibacteraceae bacterium]|jgi:Zn-dependent M28 family amino/carboxypeptidase